MFGKRKPSHKHTAARRCNAGHIMDPNWETCPYCRRENTSFQQTQTNRTVNASTRRPTDIGRHPAQSDRITKPYSKPVYRTRDQGPEVPTHRIVGILITYTWRPEGQLFAVREGRNYIGSGEVGSEADHGWCEIYIDKNVDPELSDEHACILYRHGKFELIDNKSTNGTFLDGRLLDANVGTELPSRAEIRTGKTSWIFMKVEAAHLPPPRDEPEPPHSWRSGRKTAVR